MKNAKYLGAATGALAAGLIAMSMLAAGPAFAGSTTQACRSDQNVSGTSYSSGAYSSKPSSTICGSVGVRAVYKLYTGSPTYYAAWTYGTYGANSTPGNIILGGNHTVTSPSSGYAGNFPFNS